MMRIVIDTSVLVAALRSRQGASQGLLRGLPSTQFTPALSVALYMEWRPFLRDPNDDMVLECAVAASCEFIITHNVKDFARASELGVVAMTPGNFLRHLETLP